MTGPSLACPRWFTRRTLGQNSIQTKLSTALYSNSELES